MERLQIIRRNWPILALLVFYIYLAFHALSGSQGLMRWVDYEQDISRYQAELESAQAERQDLEARVNALKASQLDLDVLDFKAREYVFVAHPDEVTIWLDQTP